MNSSTLRKAAILVSVLDTKSADALLDSMPAEFADKVRAAVMNLDDISTSEQEQVIQEFLGQGSKPDAEVELELSSSAEVAVESPIAAPSRLVTSQVVAQAAEAQPTEAPFTFLNDASSETLAAVLQREQPQLTAVVLAHLDPARAAEVLSHLPDGMAAEVLVRIAKLDEMSPDVLADIEGQLRTTLSPHLRAKQESQKGLARLQAILAKSSMKQRETMLGAVARKDQRLVSDLNQQTRENAAKIKLHSAAAATKPTSRPAVKQPAAETSGMEFSDLFALDDDAWQKLLQEVDQNIILLAFAGAEPKLIERILRGFPRREADAWRREFSHPGPVRLRDIDAAQRALVKFASELFRLQPTTRTRPNYAAVA